MMFKRGDKVLYGCYTENQEQRQITRRGTVARDQVKASDAVRVHREDGSDAGLYQPITLVKMEDN